jgi:hypothetical protein
MPVPIPLVIAICPFKRTIRAFNHSVESFDLHVVLVWGQHPQGVLALMMIIPPIDPAARPAPLLVRAKLRRSVPQRVLEDRATSIPACARTSSMAFSIRSATFSESRPDVSARPDCVRSSYGFFC